MLSRLLPRRRAGWVWVGFTAGALVNGLRLQARARALKVIGTDHEEGDGGAGAETGAAAAAAGGGARMRLLTARAVSVDAATAAAAASHAAAHGLEVLDLVPADLRLDEAYEMLRTVDPATYASRPLAQGRGPRQATLADQAVLDRAGIVATEGLGAARYVNTISRLKRYAAWTTDLAVAPGLAAVPGDPAERRAYLSTLYAKGAPVVAAAPALQLVALAAGLAVSPGWGTAALAAYLVQPYMVMSASALSPPDLTPAGVLERPLRQARAFVSTVLGPPPAPEAASLGEDAALGRGQTPEDVAAQDAEYEELLRDGIERFFEPRRQTCPLCGSAAIRLRLTVQDFVQWKPGRFELDDCGACGHVFQNPRLTVEGLDFYYKDFYEGVGGELLDLVFSSSEASYRGRAEMVKAHTSPARWLDVGAGQGHFCVVAAGVLPGTRFEGLDLSGGIAEAEKRGWIDRSHIGLFPELAAELAGRFDVVSMHHYLEHTRDPAGELAAAAKVLGSGGYFLIEVPDPEASLGRFMGAMWGAWFQPQHQHFLSIGNLARLLGEHGFTVVAEERGPAHQPNDLTFALLLVTNRLAGPPARPWAPPPGVLDRGRRVACFAVAAPLFPTALVADHLLALVLRRLPGGPNTYRILARKD